MFLCTLLAGFAGALAQTPAPKQAAAATDNTPIVGIWRGEMDGLPAITLNVTDEGGGLSGAILFYLHRRDEGKPVIATPGVPEPIFNLKFDGKTLIFQVSHRHAHPPETLADPPVTFRFKMTAPNRIEYKDGDGNAPVFVLIRSDY
jgi:hypothetical protein